MTQPTPTSVSRVQRVIAYMIAAMVIVSVIAFIVILGAAYFGGSGEFDRGVWPVVALVPLIALPLAVVGWIALLVVSLRRRALDAAAAPPLARGSNGATSPVTPSRSNPPKPKLATPRSSKPGSSGSRGPRPS